MDKERETRRVFLGIECRAPWPDEFPKGRIIKEEHRHATLVFLGNVNFELFQKQIPSIPRPDFNLGFTGIFSHCHFFPKRKPHVVAWEVDLQKRQQEFLDYQQTLKNWVQDNGYSVDERPYLPHVTVSRGHFQPSQWKKTFQHLPLMLKDIHVYESLGSSEFKKIWTHTLDAPFTEIDHTADIAFVIKGRSEKEILDHATSALAFEFPEILDYVEENTAPKNLNDVIRALNRLVALADAEVGTPFKAVSYHGDLIKTGGCLIWEMIVDV